LGFLKDDVLKKMFGFYKRSMSHKISWNLKVIFKCKNHFDESLKQIFFGKNSSNFYVQGFMKVIKDDVLQKIFGF